MNKTDFFYELYKIYGPVTRARNTFFYTKKGVRLTDCYQENGRAILGWEGGSAFTYFKNTLSRGQVGSFITEDHSRLKKAVTELLASNRNIHFFSKKLDALKAGLALSPEKTAVFRPWANTQTNWPEVDCLVLNPPLPWTDTVFILATKEELKTDKEKLANTIELPYALQAALTRAIYNLIKALQEREEKDWFIYDPVLTKYFKRKGPYLYPKIPQEKYDDFLLHCLKLGIVFNPDYREYSIVPFGADKGVFTKLKNSPFIY